MNSYDFTNDILSKDNIYVITEDSNGNNKAVNIYNSDDIVDIDIPGLEVNDLITI